MATSTPRTPRKTAAAKTEAVTVQETPPQTPAAESPQAPDAAPLEPPAAPQTPAEPPQQPAPLSPAEAIPDQGNLSDVILDDATKETPHDLEAVFSPELPYGANLVCNLRLVERAFLGPHSHPIERLLQPEGAIVAPHVAARVMERLEAQAARLAAPAEQ